MFAYASINCCNASRHLNSVIYNNIKFKQEQTKTISQTNLYCYNFLNPGITFPAMFGV